MKLCLSYLIQNINQKSQEDISLHLIGQNWVTCTPLLQWDLRKQVYNKGELEPLLSALGLSSSWIVETILLTILSHVFHKFKINRLKRYEATYLESHGW